MGERQLPFPRLALQLLAALILPSLLTGCFSLRSGEEASVRGEPVQMDEAYTSEPAPVASASRNASGAMAAAPMAAGSADLATVASPDDSGTPVPGDEELPVARLRVYSADMELSVGSVQETRQEIIDYAEGIGGYIESSGSAPGGEYLVIRVPAEHFDQALAQIQSYGEVLSRSVQTADVTDQFFDLERRLEIATSARDRLYQLLERSEEADERVAILRDIRRLTEEIEQLRSSLESLSRLIQFSRIAVQLRARIQTNQLFLERIPFAWIAQLDPLQVTVWSADAPFDVAVPSQFAVFDAQNRVQAESADGVRIRIGGRPNNPVGDASFWQQALEYHLGPLYKSAEPVRIGDFMGVILVSKDPKPFSFLIAVVPRGQELIVAEVFFPDAAARSALEGPVFDMLREVHP
ncbi:MAG: DUF4349 domain-containing protein [Spirochaetales bacterium]|nr:MAG: DUF4349 domain-containing protein [Spirochaetales bacterium]